MAYTYQYPRPALTVDCVVFAFDDRGLKVLLIQRDREPFQGCWAFPGGFVNVDEELEAAARRELEEETGVRKVFLEQLHTFGTIGRDPRERVVSVVYYGLVRPGGQRIKAGSDARDAAWFAVADRPPLAFDHEDILRTALARLKEHLRDRPIAFELLPPRFTLAQLQRLYEVVLDRPVDKRKFRKKMLGTSLLVELDQVRKEVARRPERLYRFDRGRYRQLVKDGFTFDV